MKTILILSVCFVALFLSSLKTYAYTDDRQGCERLWDEAVIIMHRDVSTRFADAMDTMEASSDKGNWGPEFHLRVQDMVFRAFRESDKWAGRGGRLDDPKDAYSLANYLSLDPIYECVVHYTGVK